MPRNACDRPIKPARSGTLTHGSIAGSSAGQGPKGQAFFRLPPTRSSQLASVSPSSSAAHSGVRSWRTTSCRRRWPAPRHRLVQPGTQLQRSFVNRQLRHRQVQIQRVAAGAAAKAMPALPLHMRRQRSAPRRGRSMHRTRATPLRAVAGYRPEAYQGQDLGQRHLLPQLGENQFQASAASFPTGTEKRNPYGQPPTAPESDAHRTPPFSAACGRPPDPAWPPGCPASFSCRVSSVGALARS